MEAADGREKGERTDACRTWWVGLASTEVGKAGTSLDTDGDEGRDETEVESSSLAVLLRFELDQGWKVEGTGMF